MNIRIIRILFFVILISYVLAKSQKKQNKNNNKNHKNIEKINDDAIFSPKKSPLNKQKQKADEIKENDDKFSSKNHKNHGKLEDNEDDDEPSEDDDDDNNSASETDVEEDNGDSTSELVDNEDVNEMNEETTDQQPSSTEQSPIADQETSSAVTEPSITDYETSTIIETETETETEFTTIITEPSIIPELTDRNDCYEIQVSYSESIKECSINQKGEITYLYIDDKLLTEEDFDKIYSYTDITQLRIYWRGNQSAIDKAVNLSNINYLHIFNTKGGNINISALETLQNITKLEISAPSSKDVRIDSKIFKNLTSLKIINLTQFKLSQENIDDIGKSTNLEEFNCNACSYINVSNYEPLKNLTKLHTIHFTSYNKYGSPIKEIPIAFTEIPSLRILILTRQKISVIPDEVANLKNLEILNLNNNILTSIPESLNSLKHLKEAYFSGALEGKILTNDSLEKCSYDNEPSLCKPKEMDCLGDESLLIKLCDTN